MEADRGPGGDGDAAGAGGEGPGGALGVGFDVVGLRGEGCVYDCDDGVVGVPFGEALVGLGVGRV